MALSEVSKNDKIEVVLSGTSDWSCVQVRNATIISRDGVELTRSYHRHVVSPCFKSGDPLAWADTDISGEDAEVQAIANAKWTSAVKTAYKAQQDANEN